MQEINADNFKILLTNARSLSPKIESLHDQFAHHDIDVALITESWLKDGSVLDRDIIDLEYGTNLKILYKNRPKGRVGARRVGGGVSIIFNKATCNLRERKIVGNKYELVLAVGRVGKIERQVAFFCLYIEPRMRVAELKQLNELLNSQLLQLKAKGDPIIYIGGDLNHRSLDDAVGDFPDIKQANFDPTRGDACLDVMYTNQTATTSGVWPPLYSRQGARSDHSCVIFSSDEARPRPFTWIKKTTRKHTTKAVEDFGREMMAADWDNIMGDSTCPDTLVARFEDFTQESIERLFPLQTIRQRSSDPPWITNAIRRLSKQKKRIYKRENKSPGWHRAAARMDRMVEESKHAFISGVMKGGTSSRNYFKAVKALSTNTSESSWSVHDLFPDRTPIEAGNEAAAYFSKIANEFEPLVETATAPTEMRDPVSLEEVTRKLKLANKPNSSVKGDILPRLMKKFHHLFPRPVQMIFNAVFASNKWPAAWKEETTVVIPKINNPETLADCRNIGCTAFLSKVLELFLLEDLRREIPVDLTQFGGLKGSSVDHLLVELLDKVLGNLDAGHPSIVLGIDFEKAFNRLNHHECLTQLRNLGASGHTIELVRAFLTGRSMKVKVGNDYSRTIFLHGGSPQGSILGCILYCLTTQQINTRLPRPRLPYSAVPSPDAAETQLSNEELEGEPEVGFQILQWHGGISPQSPPNLSPPGTPNLHDGGNEIDREKTAAFKYIDDTTVVETVDKDLEIRHVSAAGPREVIPADGVAEVLASMKERADDIGMRINCKKTQMICFAPTNGYTSSASIKIGQERINTKPSMKLLGFQLGQDVSHHVALVRDKFRRNFWSLIKLRRARITGEHLFRLYGALVRPVLETNSVVFHPMLSQGQREEIERMQKLAIRLCFGNFDSYKEVVKSRNIVTLEERRRRTIRAFTAKIMKDDKRFAPRWLVRREDIGTDLRNRRPYVEKKARTEKYYNSPLLYIQRTANDIATSRHR